MLIVVRHGRTEANAAGALLGRRDLPLDELGRRQAAALAAPVRGARRAVTSPLRRARETAEALGLPTTVDERLIELDYGTLEGTPLTDVPADVWRRWASDLDHAPGGGESIRALGARVRAVCEELVEEAASHDVVLVSHVSPIKACVAWALGVDDSVAWRMHVAPASVTRIAVAPPRPSLHAFNHTAHLEGLDRR